MIQYLIHNIDPISCTPTWHFFLLPHPLYLYILSRCLWLSLLSRPSGRSSLPCSRQGTTKPSPSSLVGHPLPYPFTLSLINNKYRPTLSLVTLFLLRTLILPRTYSAGMMFLFVALICFSSAIIVSSIAHSHSHSHPNHLGGQGLGLDLGLALGGVDDNLDMAESVNRDNHHAHAHGSYYEPIGDEPSPRTPATP